MKTQKEVHLRKSEAFYNRKRSEKLKSQKYKTKAAITMDFQKNLNVPNISTNDAYYRRKLSFFMFNIHQLSDSESYFFTYPETSGKKGADEVCSFLWDYVCNHLATDVQDLTIFCDSCGGQNKNYTVFRMLHYIVHYITRLNSITVVFPIRGHSYLECDKNMGLVNQKSLVELPQQWNDVVQSSRSKPKLFVVINCENQNIFKGWTSFLSTYYVKKCPFKSRPIREIKIVKEHPQMIIHRSSYNGSFEQSIVTIPKRKQLSLPEGQFYLPPFAYDGLLPISKSKYDDLQHLKKFCSLNNQEYYNKVPLAPVP